MDGRVNDGRSREDKSLRVTEACSVRVWVNGTAWTDDPGQNGSDPLRCQTSPGAPCTQAPIAAELLKEYIAFARATCHPALTSEAAEALATSYAEMRSMGMSRKVFGGRRAAWSLAFWRGPPIGGWGEQLVGWGRAAWEESLTKMEWERCRKRGEGMPGTSLRACMPQPCSTSAWGATKCAGSWRCQGPPHDCLSTARTSLLSLPLRHPRR